MIAFSKAFHFPNFLPQRGPTTPVLPKQYRFGLFRVRSPLLAESLLFSPPMDTYMFQFPTFASLFRMAGLQPAGLPHSEIRGSKIICIYPQLIAAYHVLHRLREPRHPPSALAYFLLSGHFTVNRIDISSACSYSLLYFTLSIMSKIFFSWQLTSHSWQFINYFVYVFRCVENNGFEPLTLCVQGRCSSQLS